MYKPFNNLPDSSKKANFEPFRKMVAHLYTLLNRLVSGKTYVDLYSAQYIATPILIENNNINIAGTLAYDSVAQIPNIPNRIEIPGDKDYLDIRSDSNYIPGMPVIFKTDTVGGTAGSLINNKLYWITSTGGTLGLSNYVNSPSFTTNMTIGSHTIELAQPLQQLNESSLLRRNNTYPTPKQGSLAYGDIVNNKSTLYYYNGSNYEMVKLGYPGGQGYYNNGATFQNTYTGWVHTNGSYKIITSNNQIKLQFNWLEVIEDGSNSKDIIQGVRTTPVSDYNVLITNSGSNGLNSLDTGTLTANTGYYIYFVYNPEARKYGAVLSTNSNKPIFPTDTTTSTQYRFYQRLGWIRTDASGNYYPSLQVDNQFVFAYLPPAAGSLEFYGSGTSPDLNLITASDNSSAVHPRIEFLDRVNFVIGYEGTGMNTNPTKGQGPNPRDYYFNNDIRICRTTSTRGPDSDGITRQVCHIFNDIPVAPFKDNYITLAHISRLGAPNESGTSYTSINTYLTGWKFNGRQLL